jgi:hypothetical protein
VREHQRDLVLHAQEDAPQVDSHDRIAAPRRATDRPRVPPPGRAFAQWLLFFHLVCLGWLLFGAVFAAPVIVLDLVHPLRLQRSCPETAQEARWQLLSRQPCCDCLSAHGSPWRDGAAIDAPW